MPEEYRCMSLQAIWCKECKDVVDCNEVKRSWFECPEKHSFYLVANMGSPPELPYYDAVQQEEPWWEEEFRNRRELEEMKEEFAEMREKVEELNNAEDTSGDRIQESTTN